MALSLPVALPDRRAASRTVRPEDATALGDLLHCAYRGTVDDEGESPDDALAEIRAALGGKYGPFLLDRSFLVERGKEAASASLIARWKGMPLLLYSVTRPARQRQGLALQLILESAAALSADGERELQLFVTAANEPAVRLYRKLGFREIPAAG